jgi:hypothetical protein
MIATLRMAWLRGTSMACAEVAFVVAVAVMADPKVKRKRQREG